MNNATNCLPDFLHVENGLNFYLPSLANSLLHTHLKHTIRQGIPVMQRAPMQAATDFALIGRDKAHNGWQRRDGCWLLMYILTCTRNALRWVRNE